MLGEPAREAIHIPKCTRFSRKHALIEYSIKMSGKFVDHRFGTNRALA
jgi:hypothetical protein